MPNPDSSDPFAAWLRAHGNVLTHLDPDAPLDDLEPLRTMLDGARVVALGENAHFIAEFACLRERLLRFLVQRLGFTVLAFEFGFSEGVDVDTWCRGGPGSLDEASTVTVPAGMAEPAHWLRAHNRAAPRPVGFAGVDIPAAGGSLLPALAPVATYLGEVDEETVPLAERAITLAKESWDGKPDTHERHELTALLTRLSIRLRSAAPLYVERSGKAPYELALRRVEAACQADYHVRAMGELYAGTAAVADTSARELFMAESVRWHLERADPNARMVLVAHNAHIQKMPISYSGRLTSFPMGQRLHDVLGEEYFALGLTSIGGNTARMRLDERAATGYVVDEAELDTPQAGSVEAGFAAARVEFGLAELRKTPTASPDRLRMQGDYLHTPVLDAFDGMLTVPRSSLVPDHLLPR